MLHRIRVPLVRLAAALVQAALLYGLVAAASASPAAAWPATEPRLFVPLALVSAGVPVLVVLGAGSIRPWVLAGWALAAAAVLAGLGFHDAARHGTGADAMRAGAQLWWPLLPALLAGFFVAQVLVTDAAGSGRLLPPYTRHFDTAWKQAVQVALAVVFSAVAWGVLGLGAGLFHLLDVDAGLWLVTQPWFVLLASTLLFAGAVHVTDVRPALLRGVRAILLRLLAFLLPLLAVLVLGFLLVLLVGGPGRLWQTHAAATALLGSAAALVVLVNATYADGRSWAASRGKRLATGLAALELPVLAGLAGWALALRVGQYGWTVNRIYGAGVLGLLGCYALGYAASTLLRRPRLLELSNFAGAYAALALVLLLFSPAADPARLFVRDQVARLHAGAVPPDAFDFATLGSEGARWGRAALAALAEDPAPSIAEAARRAPTRDSDARAAALRVLPLDQLAGRITVLPEGRSIPAALLQAQIGAANVPSACFRAGGPRCTLRFVTFVPGEPEAVLLLDGGTAEVYQQDGAGQWRRIGLLLNQAACPAVQEALGAGRFSLAPHAVPDVMVGDLRLAVTPDADGCP